MLALEAKKIDKTFPGVHALKEVDFELEEGEVHALVGENGAGKSTLVKILTGVELPDHGTITVFEKTVSSIKSPQEAFDMGISVMHQELSTMLDLDVATNIFAGRLPRTKFGLVNWKKAHSDATVLLESFDTGIKSKDIARNLNVSQHQLIEIVKAVSKNAKIIFMDEPTSSLSTNEVEKLFNIISELKKKKITIIFISHKLEEIVRIADRVTVLRDGNKIITTDAKSITVDDIIGHMIGESLDNRYPKEYAQIGEPLLEVRNLNRGRSLRDVSFTARRGEILALTGLMGAGRTETVRAIFGADHADSGEIFVEGKKVNIRNVRDAVNAGIALVTEDRKNQGLFLHLTVEENIQISSINAKTTVKDYAKFGFLKKRELRNCNKDYCDSLNIKTPSLRQKVSNLSGGNQQKVVVAKWLATRPRVIMFDEPTRGIDVGAKAEMYKIMENLAKEGNAIIMISAEIPEVLNISDRILVMRSGSIVAEMDSKTATQNEILKYSTVEVKNG